MKQNVEKEDLDTQEYNRAVNLLRDIIHECKSRSGLCTLPSNKESVFGLIFANCLKEYFTQFIDVEEGNISGQELKNNFINMFMTLHHKYVEQKTYKLWD